MRTSLPQTYQALVAKDDSNPPRLQDLPIPTPSDNQILVKIAFAPINPSDVHTLQGLHRLSPHPPYPVGLEGSGVVAAVGENLNRPFGIGDKVHVYLGGTIAQYALVPSENVSPMDEDLTFQEAASHIINPATVCYMLSLAKKEDAKTVITTGASSTVGRMFVRDLKEKGIKSINVVRQDKYIEDLKKEGGYYVLNSEAEGFEEKLKELVEKEKVRVVFDSINGDFTDKILGILPENSTCYVYGSLGGNKYKRTETKEVENGKKIVGIQYLQYVKECQEKGELDKFYEEIHKPLKTIFKTQVQKVFPLDEVFDAIEYYEANRSKGRVLIKPN